MTHPSMSTNPGVLELYDPSLAVSVLETRIKNRHSHVVGRWPHDAAIETEFDSGPLLGFHGRHLVNDGWDGISMTPEGAVIRESTVIRRLSEEYAAGPRHALHRTAQPCRQVVLPMTTRRADNYCHWWMDCVAKLFVARRCGLLGPAAPRQLQVRFRKPATAFQAATLDVLMPQIPVDWKQVGPNDPFTIGPTFNSPGLTYGSSQRVAAAVAEYASWLRALFSVEEPAQAGRRIYLSRREASMRRVVNEAHLEPMLAALGFEVLCPGQLTLAQQAQAFSAAAVVVAPHGAGLTNILFCRPDARVVEIFPEGGVHGSTFMRIASQRGMPYAFAVARAVPTAQGAANSKNNDMSVDAQGLQDLLQQVV